MRKNFFLLLTISLVCSCAPTRFVKPLNEKQQAVNLAIGGPLIDYSSLIIPMPFLTATYGYGIDSTLTGFGSLNITSAVYGNLQMEVGVTKRISKQNGRVPAISINPVANVIYRNKDAFKLYPQIDINAYWDYNRGRNFFYVGVNNWFELGSKVNFDEEQKSHWLITPMIGETFVRRKWNYNVELKVIAPNMSSERSVVEYKTPLANRGALGIYFGVTRKF
ncbi:MAG TPA: hypothetical protein VF622_09760 [Segetibacter sp.]|jgi:hypothetical protein